MAETTEKYKATKDGIEINAGGIMININFAMSTEEFARIGNNIPTESDETKQDLLTVLNEEILTAYNTIINGSSAVANSFQIKKNYSKKISDLYARIKNEITNPYLCKIKSNNNSECYIDDKNIEFFNDKSSIERAKIIQNEKNEIKEHYSAFMKAIYDGYENCKYGFDNWLETNTGDWICHYYMATIDDYLKKTSYINCGNSSVGNWGDWDFNNPRNYDYKHNTEYFPFGKHYELKKVRIVPAVSTIEGWFKGINKSLESYGFKVAEDIISTFRGMIDRRENRDYLTKDDIIVSKSKETKNPLMQIFDDCTANKDLGKAIQKYFEDFNINYENKNIKNISSALKESNYFNLNESVLGSNTNVRGITRYICEAMQVCFKGLKTAEANNAENIMNFFKKHSSNYVNNKFSSKGFSGSFIDVDNYYDFYSTMAPGTKLTFISNKGRVCIDNIKYSFIKSVKMTDNGAKKFEIVLYDRDFNTPIIKKTVDKNGNPVEVNYGSLDKIIARTLNLNSGAKNEADNKSQGELKKYKLGASNFGDMLGFNASNYNSETNKWETPTKGNLLIEFGFNDANQPIKNNIRFASKKETDNRFTVIGKTEYLTDDSDLAKNRNARWWHVNTEDSEVSNKTILERAIISSNPTTVMTNKIETIITGYKTKFTEGGIYYTIEAIEYSNNILNNYKIYQRYTNIVGTPKEVLYSVIKIIENLFKGEIKIFLEEELVEEGGIYEDIEEVLEDDSEGEKTIGSKVKEISVSLGTKDAISMYRDDAGGITKEVSIITRKEAKMYKSVASLLNDLCAVMPAKLDENMSTEDSVIEDEDGNSKKVNEAYKTYRKFKYIALTEGRETNIYFYYQRPRKFEKIRRYNWGPANSRTSVVKSVDISTENEYSLLSSMTVINYGDDGKPNKKLVTRDGGFFDAKGNFNVQPGSKADYISSPGNGSNEEKEIAMSYAQCLYKGKITVLGDPFYIFDKFVTPYCYPIYIDFKIPMSEIDVGKRYESNKKTFGKNEDDTYRSAKNATRIGYSHFMSGFYVITDIEHTISETGFTTTLGVMSYPNIPKDIGLNINN